MVKINEKFVSSALMVIILFIVGFSIYAELTPELASAGQELNDSNRCSDAGCYYYENYSATSPCRNNNSAESYACAYDSVPLSGVFNGTNSIAILVVIVAFLVVVVRSLIKSKK